MASSSSSFVMSLAALEQCYHEVCNKIVAPCKTPVGISYQMNLDNMEAKKTLFSNNELALSLTTMPISLGIQVTFNAKSEVNWTWPKTISAKPADEKSFVFMGSSYVSLLNVFDQEDGFDCVSIITQDIVGKNYHTRVYLAKTFPVQRDYWKCLKTDTERRSFLYFTLNNVFKPEYMDAKKDKLAECYCPNLDEVTDDHDMPEWKNLRLNRDVKVLKAGLKSSIEMNHERGVVRGDADIRILCTTGPLSFKQPTYHTVDFRKEESFIVIVERYDGKISTFLTIAWIQNK